MTKINQYLGTGNKPKQQKWKEYDLQCNPGLTVKRKRVDAKNIFEVRFMGDTFTITRDSNNNEAVVVLLTDSEGNESSHGPFHLVTSKTYKGASFDLDYDKLKSDLHSEGQESNQAQIASRIKSFLFTNASLSYKTPVAEGVTKNQVRDRGQIAKDGGGLTDAEKALLVAYNIVSMEGTQSPKFNQRYFNTNQQSVTPGPEAEELPKADPSKSASIVQARNNTGSHHGLGTSMATGRNVKQSSPPSDLL